MKQGKDAGAVGTHLGGHGHTVMLESQERGDDPL